MGNTRRPREKTYPVTRKARPTPRRYLVRRRRPKEPKQPSLFGMKAPKFRHTKNKYRLFKNGGCMLPIVAIAAAFLPLFLIL